MKKFAWILIAAAVLAVIVVPTMAFANNGPHGGFVADTDMCAACHRAHTAPSSITWTGTDGSERNALLITDSAESYLFCLACHDAGAQGADTNVVDGRYEGTEFGGETTTTLISGPFGREDGDVETGQLIDGNGMAVTSSHVMNGQSWGAYGGGVYGSTSSELATGSDVVALGTGAKIVMDCTTCHDPHGSSNYRILKDSVYGVAVGGYVGGGANPTPAPYVISNELGYPLGGFALHTTYPNYEPDYTVAKYAKAPGGDVDKGMTNWCAGCHTAYAYDGTDWASGYDAADGLGFTTRHRHPMNVELDAYTGFTPLVTDNTLGLPLAHAVSGAFGTGSVSNDATDWIDCMTCHNAHGTTATMSGYADGAATFELGDGEVLLRYPAPDSALLKMNNRGVCEACHNK